MILLALALSSAAAAAAPDWRPYAVRAFGFGDSAIDYDAGRIDRRATVVRVWTHRRFHYSGRNPSDHHIRYEIDCGRRLAHAIAAIDYPNITYRERPRTRRLREAFAPIAPDSDIARLAERVCDGATPAAPSSWTGLPDPTPSVAEAHFFYDPAVRRRDGRLRAWIRYVTIDARILRQAGYRSTAEIRTDALIELDCTARTQRTLERLTIGLLHKSHDEFGTDAPGATIEAGSREAALATRLCGAG